MPGVNRNGDLPVLPGINQIPGMGNVQAPQPVPQNAPQPAPQQHQGQLHQGRN